MWKKKVVKKEEEPQPKEVSLLEELCGDDKKLCDFLNSYLCLDPLVAIPKTPLDNLIEEGEKSGNFRSAIDKAIFEGSQNPGEKERYINIIQDLAVKTIHATEQEKVKVEAQGLPDRAVFLGRRIEDQRFIAERTEDIVNIATKFYNERLLELEEDVRREDRKEQREEAREEEWRKGQREEILRQERKRERSKMGREERKEAERLEKQEELAAEERKAAKAQEITEAESEEKRIEELEKADREARKKNIKGN